MSTVVIAPFNVVNYPEGSGHFWVYLQYALGLRQLGCEVYWLARFRRTALVDIDPGLLQFWISRKQLSVPRHDFYFTISENVGKPGGRIPDCGLGWIPIQPAVCLERWPYTFDPRAEAFTTVSIWDSSDGVVDREEEYEN